MIAGSGTSGRVSAPDVPRPVIWPGRGQVARAAAAFSPIATAVAAGPRRGTPGSTDVSATRRPSIAEHAQVGVHHSAQCRAAAQVDRGRQVGGDPGVEGAVVAQHVATGFGARTHPRAQEVGARAQGVAQASAVVLGAQVAVGDAVEVRARRGCRAAGGST